MGEASFLQYSQRFQILEAGLTKKLSRMGAEHFVTSSTKPDDVKKKQKRRTESQRDRNRQKTKHRIKKN